MKPYIVLDSAPLGLLFQRVGVAPADTCRAWAKRRMADGARLLVPEIIHYELRRELLRLGKTRALSMMGRFVSAEPDRFMRLNSHDLELAAELWADSRRRGMATADARALDIDVILAAQVKNLSVSTADVVVATSNVKHLSQFIPADEWASA